jgi:hypothetical protein
MAYLKEKNLPYSDDEQSFSSIFWGKCDETQLTKSVNTQASKK